MPSSVQFPTTAKGDKSTTTFGKEVVAAGARALGDEALATSALAEKNWRQKYSDYFHQLTVAQVACALKDEAKAMGSVRACLDQAKQLCVESEDGCASEPMHEAMSKGSDAPLAIAKVKGSGSVQTVEVPQDGQRLAGAELLAAIDEWVAAGAMEPDCAAAMKRSAGAARSLAGRTFVVLGAGSELGPLPLLLQAGATVCAVATRSKPERWAKLLALARSSAGELWLPVPAGTASTDEAIAQVAGADLLGDAPGVQAWVMQCAQEAQGPVTVGSYLYMDGEANVRINAVADDILATVAAALGPKRASFAFLGSPSHGCVVPPAAAKARHDYYAQAPFWHRMSGFKTNLVEPLPGASEEVYVHDGYMNVQGQNYALAQHVKSWRAVLLHHEGFPVSTPIAPVSRTSSVTHVKSVGTAMGGMAYIPPLTVFDPDTAQALLYLIMEEELCGEAEGVRTPFHVVARNAFHGGTWRVPYHLDSMGTAQYVLGALRPLK